MFYLDLKIGDDDWLRLTAGDSISFENSWVSINNATIENIFMNSKKQYAPDILKFDIISLAGDTHSLVNKIKNTEEINVRVFEDRNMVFYGSIENKRTLRINRNHLTYRMKAKDFISALDKPSPSDWNFRNENLDAIASALCSSVTSINTAFHNDMALKTIPHFFATNISDTGERDSILKILDNFLYEYGFVLRANYIGTGYYIGSGSYRDRFDTHSTNLTAKDIYQGRVHYKGDEKKETKLFKTNYRIVSNTKVNDILLYADAIGGWHNIVVPAGGLYPEDGDSKIQWFEHTVIHRDTFEKSPDEINLNNKLQWGTITKNAEVLWSDNHTITYSEPPASGYPEIIIRDHFPTRSRVVWRVRPDSIRTVVGLDYRVIGDTLVRGIPPGCSLRKPTDRDDSGEPTSLQNFYGKWTPTRFYYTREFYPTRREATAASEVSAGQRRCTGREELYWVPVFETRRARKLIGDAKLSDINIRGDAWISIGQGTTVAGFLGGDLSTKFDIKNIWAGDSTDSNGNIIKKISYQFFDTPEIDGKFNGWYMLTENGTLTKISRYKGTPAPPVPDRWGYVPAVPPGKVVEFQWTEGLYPPNWITRRGVLGNQPYVTEDPLPILDKIGTEVVFFQPNQAIKQEIVETSFLYNIDDASDFVQGLLNDSLVNNAELTYEGYADNFYPSVKHPGVGEYVNVNLPEYEIHNERFIVNRYEFNLNKEENPKVGVDLRRTKRFEPGKKYPDIVRIFPSC